jgi:hypothetical protein
MKLSTTSHKNIPRTIEGKERPHSFCVEVVGFGVLVGIFAIYLFILWLRTKGII